MSQIMKMKKYQTGLSIIEFMVAITLGLILLAGITQIFLTNKNTFNITDSLGRLEENGRFAMEILAQNVRMAGYQDPGEDLPPPFYSADESDTPCVSANTYCTNDGGGNTSDRIAVRFNPRDNKDCTGTLTTETIANVFWVQDDPANNDLPTLYCRGYTPGTGWIAAAQPIVPGIENFQVLYGVASGAGTAGVPDKYVTATQISSSEWAKVKSVRIAVLARAGGSTGGEVTTRNFSVLDAGGLSYTDNQPRALYSTTISLNNIVL